MKSSPDDRAHDEDGEEAQRQAQLPDAPQPPQLPAPSSYDVQHHGTQVEGRGDDDDADLGGRSASRGSRVRRRSRQSAGEAHPCRGGPPA